MVYLAYCCGKHLSTYLYPVAITVEISKTDFCTCSSSQFSWIGSLTKSAWSGLYQCNGAMWWEKCSSLLIAKQTYLSTALSCLTHPVLPLLMSTPSANTLPATTLILSAWLLLFTWQCYSDHAGCCAEMWRGKKSKPPHRFLVLLTFVFCFMRWHKENVLGGLVKWADFLKVVSKIPPTSIEERLDLITTLSCKLHLQENSNLHYIQIWFCI